MLSNAMAQELLPTFDPLAAVPDIAAASHLPVAGVRGAVELLVAGNTIPFIARYRKERTRGLDERALRAVEDALCAHEELADRKATILRAIASQGKLDDALRRKIHACKDRRLLEEMYLPYRPKRRTRAAIARERGLEPLAEMLLSGTHPTASRETVLKPSIDPARGIPDEEAALRGACDIVAEAWAENPEVRAWTRGELEKGTLRSRVRDGWRGKPSKFELYYDHREPLARVPSHRFLAMRRGASEEILRVGIEADEDRILRNLTQRLVRNPRSLFHAELVGTVADCYRRLLFPSLESAILAELRQRAEEEAIEVFARNLEKLLLAPPAGHRVVMGIDPGFRTGAKVAVVDAIGRLLEHVTIYPAAPHHQTAEAGRILVALLERHAVELIAIGNGTASRETDAFVAEALAQAGSQVSRVVVSESGASVYSASEVARREFPDLDVTVRGAISIARRLQDPLAELVKIDPRSIGVGQYQHDVHQRHLQKALDREVISCVNRVGVDLNTASAELLAYVAGLGRRLAESVVKHREAHGPYPSRREVLSVPGIGPRAFEQAAGFLRVRGGSEPLDDSAVHPESYGVVERIARSVHVSTAELIGNGAILRALDPREFVDAETGIPTVEDILRELEKPGRDPRRRFELPRFRDEVRDVSDLRTGMVLEGVVTNVTRFGAFVDIGVHRDGLVHVSQLDRSFVRDPSEVVSVGDIVRVRVLDVDRERGRIALSRKDVV